ncbi:MAG: hypothetical protein H6621_08240 [Halobacteriovoraceae bacterium]|nr:hypothetical protein [Halobacteriovoraceae bacterium]
MKAFKILTASLIMTLSSAFAQQNFAPLLRGNLLINHTESTSIYANSYLDICLDLKKTNFTHKFEKEICLKNIELDSNGDFSLTLTPVLINYYDETEGLALEVSKITLKYKLADDRYLGFDRLVYHDIKVTETIVPFLARGRSLRELPEGSPYFIQLESNDDLTELASNAIDEDRELIPEEKIDLLNRLMSSASTPEGCKKLVNVFLEKYIKVITENQLMAIKDMWMKYENCKYSGKDEDGHKIIATYFDDWYSKYLELKL